MNGPGFTASSSSLSQDASVGQGADSVISCNLWCGAAETPESEVPVEAEHMLDLINYFLELL